MRAVQSAVDWLQRPVVFGGQERKRETAVV